MLTGEADAEERLIRTVMSNTEQEFKNKVFEGQHRQYDRIPLGRTSTAHQIMQTARAFQLVYERPVMKVMETQTNDVSATADPDELERMFNESWSTDDDENKGSE